MTKAELMARLEEIADAEFGGHFTVMKFTTNWRVSFGIPRMNYNDVPVNERLEMCVGKTFEEAAMAAIETRREAMCVTWVKANRREKEMCAEIDARSEEEIAADEAELLRFYEQQQPPS